MGSTVVKAMVGIVAVVLLFVVARATIATHGSHLQVEFDAVSKKAIVKVDGGESLPLSEILRALFQRDPSLTKATVCSWGVDHGVIDAEDTDALRKFGLLVSDDFWGLWRTIKRKHSGPENVSHLQRLAAYAAAKAPVQKRHVVLTWHPSTEMEGDAILFPQGDEWFAERLDKRCDIAIGQNKFPAVIYGPTRLSNPDRIQVSEGTFVRIISRATGRRVLPPVNSKQWKAITGRGTVPVDILC